MLIVKKGTKIYSVMHLKCPRCHEGNLFLARNPYDLKRMLNMPNACLICQQDFKMEPGFYSGALWTSYPIVVLVIILVGLLSYSVKLSLGATLTLIIIICLLLQPVIMRYARAIWINIFVHYKGRH